MGLGLVALGCTGNIGDRSVGDVPPGTLDCNQAALQDSPVRRLTRWEYNNTVRDLLGDQTHPADSFAPESVQLGFTNGAASPPMSATVVEEYEAAALDLAAQAVADPNALLPCDPIADGEDACAKQFVAAFGRRAFRRPLEAAELAAYGDFYAAQKATFGFAGAIEMVVAAMLQSPMFLYQVEIGMPAPGAGALRLTGYETATRLSYLLWGTMPDDELLDAAEKGELDTAEKVRARAEAMIDDDRGARAITDFYVQWARLAPVPTLHKNAPEFTPTIGELMLTETSMFVDHVVRQGEGTVEALLTKPVTYMNADLAAFYGIDGGPTGAEFEEVALDPTRYAGVLTHGSLLATLAHEAQPSPVYRGKFVLEQLLCSPPPPPPDNVNTQLPAPDPKKTLRQQMEELTANQPCFGCHSIMNPPGFAFDHFDAVGRWRDDDRGLPIDTTGDLKGPDDATGSFADHVELAGILAGSEAVRGCMVQQWFHYAYGRGEGDLDGCSMGQLGEAFEASGGNIRTLLLELTQTPAFLYRVDPKGGQQ